MTQPSVHSNPRVCTPYGIISLRQLVCKPVPTMWIYCGEIEGLKRGMLGMMIACMQNSIEDDDLEVEKAI